MAFDLSDSSAISEGKGRGNNAFFILETAGAVTSQAVDFRDGNDLPTLTIEWADDYTGRDPNTGEPTAGSYDSLFGQAVSDERESNILQVQLDGLWENAGSDPLEKIQFGADFTDVDYHRVKHDSGQTAAGWFGGNNDLYDNAIFTRESARNLFDSFSGGDSNVDFYYDWDYEQGVAAFEQGVDDGVANFGPAKLNAFTGRENPVTEDYEIGETTYSPYVQFTFGVDVADMPVSLVTGLRYEKTDVTSDNIQITPETVAWTSATADEVNVQLSNEATSVSGKGDYDLWLPNIDFSIEPMEDIVTRLSYSRSVTRPTLSNLRATTNVGGVREGTADQGNPDLLPFTAVNFDLSLEWYYGESSYASIGFYRKKVDNFIVNRVTTESLFGLRDPRRGGDYAQAEANLGSGATAADIFEEINRIRGIGAAERLSTPVTADENNELIQWRVTRPENVEIATLHGWEFAVQHIFGDSGFGVLANATLAMGDIDVDPAVTDFQFSLTGLSDSYNIVGFYEKHGFQVRVAYNWRDEFLSDSGAVEYTEEFGQLDFSTSYEFSGALEGLTVTLEGLNVTGESSRTYHRYEEQLRMASQYEPRYNLGLRYKFF